MTYAIELSHKQSLRILECACRAEHDITLTPKSWPTGSTGLCGKLTSFGDDVFGLEIRQGETPDLPALVNTYCQFDLQLEDGQYFFDSHITAIRQCQGADHLMVAHPNTILVRQRRRSKRKPLAKSSRVYLSRQVDQRLDTLEGQLYNLSLEGVAFKIPKSEIDQIKIGETWCACFEVPEQEHVYKFEGTICRMLPSSSTQSVILGMQFDQISIEEAELSKLRQFLADRQQAYANIGGNQ